MNTFAFCLLFLITISYSNGKWYRKHVQITLTTNASDKSTGVGNFSRSIIEPRTIFQLNRKSLYPKWYNLSDKKEANVEKSNSKQLRWTLNYHFLRNLRCITKNRYFSKLIDFPLSLLGSNLNRHSEANSPQSEDCVFTNINPFWKKSNSAFIAHNPYTVSSATKKNFGLEICKSLEDQINNMYAQFDGLQRHLQHEQHWSSMVQSQSIEKQLSNQTFCESSSSSIKIWLLNTAAMDELLAQRPFNDHLKGTDENMSTNITRRIEEDSFYYNTLSRNWPFVRAQCWIPQLQPKQLFKVLWHGNSATELLKSQESRSSFSAVSLEHRYDLLRFDERTRLVWSRFKFPWSGKMTDSVSLLSNNVFNINQKESSELSKAHDVSGELLSLSHYFFDSRSQSYVLMSQSVAPVLAQALINFHEKLDKKYKNICTNAEKNLNQILSAQLQRSHVRLSISLLSPTFATGSQPTGTALTQLSQTQWQYLPAVIVWRTVVPATISYLNNVKRLAPLLFERIKSKL